MHKSGKGYKRAEAHGGHGVEKPQVRGKAHVREVFFNGRKRKCVHESERKHITAYSQQKESMCQEEVKACERLKDQENGRMCKTERESIKEM